jgi:hypothetical protein
MGRLGIVALVASAALAPALAPGATSASAATCVSPTAYPGDAAPKEKIAAWMATGAGARGIPGELPVMAALVESDLQNLDDGDADSLGYFQMRKQYWDEGEYAGYPDNPPLQLEWFVDYALKNVPANPADSSGWGEWIANVERPAAQYRGRYQPKLPEAQWLISAGCEAYSDGTTPVPPPTTTPPPAVVDDKDPPVVKLTSLLEQDVVARRGIVVSVACPAEACTAKARASLSVPGTGAETLEAPAAPLGAGDRIKLKLRVGTSLRRAISSALRRGKRLRAKVKVTAADSAGNRVAVTRTVLLVAGD